MSNKWKGGSRGKIPDKEFYDICKLHNGNSEDVIQHIKEKYDVEYQLSSVRSKICRARKKGLLPLSSGNKVGNGEILKGTSTLYDESGGIKQQWVKTDVDKQDQLDMFKDAIKILLEPVEGIAKPTKVQTYTNDNMMSVYTIGDAHIGMLAWDRETGANNDLKTVEEDLLGAMSMLTEQSNPTEEAFIIDVGDYFHSDNMENKTARGGNHLDVEGRYPKVLEIGFKLATSLVDMSLKKHKLVRWRSAIGNHNEHSAIMLNAFMKAYYRNEPRVIVHDTPNPFMYHQYGKNLIGVTHGHTAKADKLGEIMSVDCEELWSSTKYRYWYTGHIHHQSVKEYPSCVVETFRTLAGKDAWHSSMGYRSGQDMKCITLHRDYGEISRNTVNVKFVRDCRVEQ